MGRFLKTPAGSHQEEIWGDEQSCELLGNASAESASEAFGCIRMPPRLPHVCTTSRLDASQHRPAADILQMVDGCVDRCGESLDLGWNLPCTAPANDSFNPTPASSLSSFLLTHSCTVYCIHAVFLSSQFFYRIPSSSFGCQFSLSQSKPCTT